MGRDKDQKRISRSRSDSRSGRINKRKRKSRDRDRHGRDVDRRSRSRERRSRSKSRSRDHRRQRDERRKKGGLDRDEGRETKRGSATEKDDILSKLAASISARVLQQETAQLDEVEKALDESDTSLDENVSSHEPDEIRVSSAEPKPLTTFESSENKEAEDRQKRKERLRIWREQQEELNRKAKSDKAESESRALADKHMLNTDASSKPLSVISLGKSKTKIGGRKVIAASAILEKDDDDIIDDVNAIKKEQSNTLIVIDEKLISNPVDMETEYWSGAVEHKTSQEPYITSNETQESDVDPLDAFMCALQSTTEVVEQDPFLPPDKSGNVFNVAKLNPFGTNSISLDEILKSGKRHFESWESDVAPSDVENAGMYDYPEFDDDDDAGLTPSDMPKYPIEDDEKEEKERKEFIETLLKQREENELKAKAILEQDNERIKQEENLGRLWASEGDITEESQSVQVEKDALTILAEQAKKKELKPVNHSSIEYINIRKNLYIVPRALANLTAEQIQASRAALEIKIRGKGCPPPVESWEQCGFRDRVLAIITKLGFEAPFAIQRQALPALMSGRDVIGVARTGSGKTLAFLLPMFRHILDQPPLSEGEGPIGLIMAPARELAVQIYSEAKKFTKTLGLRVTAVYGGAGVADQIGDLKRGADIVVCTPGRMIDILSMQAGKLVSFSRVSFVVMDEADRMFDMGFEPQIKMIMQNIRPDRQTALFSATFPPKVEQLARKVLNVPLEIIVGGRSVASECITQHVEVREEDDKYMRLLQLLGIWYERGNVLIFVDTQQKADSLFQDLTRSGYPALSLHGGKDQSDRDFTISDFKTKVRTLMVATSVAGRGLDVPELVCVINYSCPNHLEDYVHRVGRTGRAGRSGTAYTFISPDEESHAPTLVKALQAANQVVPPELQAMSDGFNMKVTAGVARKANCGFSGKGYTFDDTEMTEAQKIRSLEKRQYEIDAGLRNASDLLGDEGSEQGGVGDDDVSEKAQMRVSLTSTLEKETLDPAVERARALATKIGLTFPGDTATAQISQAAALQQAKLIAQQLSVGGKSLGGGGHYEEIIDINEYPQQARWKVTQSESIAHVEDSMGVAIVRRGIYTPPGKKLQPGEERLHLRIEGSHQLDVQNAKAEIQRMLNEETMKVAGHQAYGKYQVV